MEQRPKTVPTERSLEGQTPSQGVVAARDAATHRRYCRNCGSIQKMNYVGPLVIEISPEWVEAISGIQDMHLYNCDKCKSTLTHKTCPDGD